MNRAKKLSIGVGIAGTLLLTSGALNAQKYDDWKPHVNCWCKGYQSGTVVKHKEFNGIPLYWKSAFWVDHDAKPGDWVDSGGTSPWEMLNTMSIHTGEEYQWVGWNSGCQKFKIFKPVGTADITLELDGTWGDQIDKAGPGVYVPTWRDGAEAAYSMIFEDFGPTSYDEFFEPAVEVSLEYPEIDFGISTIVGAMDDTKWKQAQQMATMGHEIINGGMDLGSAYPYYEIFFVGDTLTKDSKKIPLPLQNLVVGSPDAEYESVVVPITYLKYNDDNSVDTQFIEKTFWLREYEYKVEDGIGLNSGEIKPNSKSWNEESESNADALRLFVSPGWALMGDCTAHIRQAKELINKNVYNVIDTTGRTTCEYFVYPEDLSANETQDSLIAAGYAGAKGGSMSGLPTFGDFYDPFRTTYDNFYMMDAEATKVFPENLFMRLSLQGLVDNLIKSKGYMTRSLKGCADVEYWDDANKVPGSLPKHLFAKHCRMLDEKIKSNEITVGTPSEIAKYRIMADAVKSVELSKSPNERGFILHVEMDSVPTQYRCDISFIVKFEEGHESAIGWHYTSHEDIALQYEPRKLDDGGKAWSVSFNPFHGDLYYEDHICIDEECDHVIGKNGKTAIIEGKKASSVAYFRGVQQNKITMSLPVGAFDATIHSLSGRVVKTSNVRVTKSGAFVSLSSHGLGQGLYVLTVQNANHVVLKEKVIIK